MRLNRLRRAAVSWAVLSATVLLGCAGSRVDGERADASDPVEGGKPALPVEAGKPTTSVDRGRPTLPGQAVNAVIPAADEARFSALRGRADAASSLDGAGAAAAYPSRFQSALGYDPLTSAYLDRIQASALALSSGEKAALGANGFVVSARREFPTFLRGLAEIYSEHLPVYISADALLESVHSSYDTILQTIEGAVLLPDVRALLAGMRSRLEARSADGASRADADLYLAVALSLLEGSPVAPVAGASADDIRALFDRATAASGIAQVKLFGSERDEDFSQFTPRGHYAGVPMLEQYFRAMMWLGRVDLRLLETQPDGTQVFHRKQFDATLLLHELVGPDLERWQRVDTTLQTFVGQSDYLVIPEVSKLVADLGGAAAAQAANNETIAQAIVAGGYGQQQIASHLMVNDGTVKTLPLNRSFCLFGQRYLVDSHVFSATVYDRIPKRMMPSPLDAAFSALSNNQALSLNPDVAKYPELPGALSRMRVLIDDHDNAFWGANFYNLWLVSLRALSPAIDPAPQTLAKVARTEAWGRRLLNTQLGSWAELRHDTLLYAKQSYTGIPGCDFPDAYVDPYPAFYAGIRRYAEAGSRIVEVAMHATRLEVATAIGSYFDNLRSAASKLEQMAELERQGKPFSSEHLAFINDAVRVERQSVVCTTVDVPNGWYAKLFFEPAKSLAFDPTIADIHTQPTDEAGNPVGKVLHAGTGYPRMMVATIDTCGGPRAYAGVVYAYHEVITTGFERLTDQTWSGKFLQGGQRPADVPWMSTVIAR